uniref:Armadillo repeat-containing domain-containing protein n=1 Tax=Panagrolaimus sp. PS1159 TaxID=55785 RepID=A0AC35GTR2_9BILA
MYDIYLEEYAIKQLMKLINHREPKIQSAAISVISNVVNVNNDQKNFVIDFGIHKLIPKLLMHEDNSAVKGTLLLLAKLFLISTEQTTRFFDTDIIPLIILHLNRVTDKEVEKPAAHAIVSATMLTTTEQILYMIDMNFMNPLCKFLLKSEKDVDRIIDPILRGFDQVFNTATDRLDELRQIFKKCFEVINRLTKHKNQKIRKLAFGIKLWNY